MTEFKCPWWLGPCNFILLQWFFVRLVAAFHDDGIISNFYLWKGVFPLTGWFGLKYWLPFNKAGNRAGPPWKID